MLTNIKSSKMVVISDLHMGNPFSNTTQQVMRFVRWAAKEGFDICINGDGLEMAQASVRKMITEMPEVIRTAKDVARQGKQIYYIVGNHDMTLEHFLEDWGPLKVSPFLNITSGDLRIRVEHGHLYDPFFVAWPNLYERLTHLGGFFLKLSPELYRLWIGFEKLRARWRARKSGIIGEPPQFKDAAFELSRRGFDVVVFGHTHHMGEVELENGHRYLNPGSWMLSCHYVEIRDGVATMRLWEDAVV